MDADPDSGTTSLRARIRAHLGAHRWIWLSVALSCLAWSLLMGLTGDKPRVVLENWCSDHYAHTMATVIFLERGLDIYRRPVGSLCDRSPKRRAATWRVARRLQVNPRGVCWLKGSRFSRPLVINWPGHPRPYPPGQLLYFLPEAVAYRHLGARFVTVNRITVIKLVVTAHLCFLVLWFLLLRVTPRGVAWVILALAGVQLLHWSLVGFYDPIAILFLLLGLLALAHDRPAPALAAFGAATLLHFRALWYLPLAAFCLYRIWQDRRALLAPGSPRRRAICWLTAGAVLLGGALLTFYLLYPALKAFPVRSALYHHKVRLLSAPVLAYLVPTAALAALLAVRKSWLALACLAWLSVFFFYTPQIMRWHALFLLPLYGLVALTPDPNHRSEQALALVAWTFLPLEILFKTQIWPGWLAEVIRRLGG